MSRERDDAQAAVEEIRVILADAETALAAARLWLVGDYADRPRSEFNAEAWQALADRVGPLLGSHPGWMHTARTFRRPIENES